MSNWINSYLNAEYYDAATGYYCRIGQWSPIWSKWIKRFGSSYTYITPFNPGSVMLPQKENRARLNEMLHLVKSKNLFCRKAYSQSPEGSFREEGIWIFDLSLSNAIKLGKYWEQNAIVYGGEFCIPELVLCRRILY